jgi:hypothetical protein
MQPLNSQLVYTMTILTTLTLSDFHVLFYIFLSFVGKCIICTILTYKFSYIFLAYSTLCLTGNILQHTYIAEESRLPRTERVEFKCKASTQMCFERDCMEHIAIPRKFVLRWRNGNKIKAHMSNMLQRDYTLHLSWNVCTTGNLTYKYFSGLTLLLWQNTYSKTLGHSLALSIYSLVCFRTPELTILCNK